MSVREPDPSRYDEDDAAAPDVATDVATDVAPSTAEAAASALLERVARERGLDVRRLDDEIVLCGDGERRVLFRGLTSSSSRKLAQVLCGNDAWLRAHLARHGLPVVSTRLVGVDNAQFAQRAAEDLGFPVRMRLAGVSDEAMVRTATDEGSFHQAWRALVQTAPDPRARAILERLPEGYPVDVPIVGGEAVGTSVAGTGASTSLAVHRAVQAHAAVPGARHSSVRVWMLSGPLDGGGQPPAGILLDTVDPSDRARGGEVAVGEDIARAVLADAFS